MANLLLASALILPIVVFWLLRSRAPQHAVRAVVLAIAAGWVCGIGWAIAAGESATIAAAFGWVCPSVLVILTAWVWRLAHGRPAS